MNYALLLIMDNLLKGYRLSWSETSEEAEDTDISQVICVDDVSVTNRLTYGRN